MISVVIPSHNRKDELDVALSSVFSQTLAAAEVIVVDDGSTDNTQDYLRTAYPMVTIIRNEAARGGAVARNQGAYAATQKFVAFLDSDDRWLPDHLKNKLSFLTKENADGVYCSFYNQTGNEEPVAVEFNPAGLKRGNLGSLILGNQRFDARTSTFIFKRSSFLELSFDEKMKKHQDWDLAINFDKKFDFRFMDDPTVVLSVSPEAVRMSNKLNHEATMYFLSKNVNQVSPNSIFLFCLKMLYRAEVKGETKQVRKQYMHFASRVRNGLSMKMKIIYYLVRSGLLSATFFYRLKKASQ